MNRFTFSFNGECSLSEFDLFVNKDVPLNINTEDILGEIDGVRMMELLTDWNMLDVLDVTLVDNETGETFESSGEGKWVLVQQTRKLLPGEQRLF